MATLQGIYIHVTSEDLQHDVELSTHPVERGIDITDNIKRKGAVLSISGKIVDFSFKRNASVYLSASAIIELIKKTQSAGLPVTYSGRNYCHNMQIKSFQTSHPNTVSGGADFDMELQEMRVAVNSYVESAADTSVKDGGTQQVDKGDNTAVYYIVKKGDCVWNLVATSDKPYYDLKRDGAENSPEGRCIWVMDNNPDAFSRSGDFKTLQIGKKLLMGYRE